MTEQTRDHSTDRIADELKLLLDVVAQRLNEYLRRDESGETCDRCPVCTVLAMARGQRTELSTRLGSQVALLLTSLRELLSTGCADTETEAATQSEWPHGRQEQRDAKVRHIDVQRVSGSVLNSEHPAGDADRTEERGC